MSAIYSAKTLLIEIKENYAIVRLNNGKVNAINTHILKDLIQVFEQLEKDDAIQGAILAGRPHVFSAGLDVMNLATMDDAGGIDFWKSYMKALQVLVTFSKPLVSAITGYAPAGATILVLCTDYRVMGKGAKHVMGMHEFKMQMQIPEMLCDVYAYHLGEIRAWKAVQNAELFNSDQALELGLVDESVEVDEVLGRAEKHLKKQMRIFPKVFSLSKKIFNKGLYKVVVERDLDQLANDIVVFNKDPKLQAKVVEFMIALKNKNKSK